MALTDLQTRKLSLKNRRYEVFDGKNGRCLRVNPTGTKTWIFRYIFEEARRRMSLGRFPGISLAKAREKHNMALQELQNGIDPGAKAREARARRKGAPTFKHLLDLFWEMELEPKPTGKERKRLAEKDALPAWGKRKVSDITRRDAVLLIDKVRERAPVTANRLQGVLARMFNFAAERGIIDHSPLTGMRQAREKPRTRVLADDEIKKLWPALELEHKDVDIYRVTKLALKIILLTGQRSGEVVGMTWAEIDKEGGFWNIPGDRMKNRDPQRVPLCPMALALLKEALVYSGESPYVFASSHSNPEHPKPVSRQAITRAVSRHWSEMGIQEAFTPHDLRRTLRTRLAGLGVSDVVAGRVLGHKLQGFWRSTINTAMMLRNVRR